LNYGSTIPKKLDIATKFQIISKGEIKLQFCVNLCKKQLLRNSHQAVASTHRGSSDAVTCPEAFAEAAAVAAAEAAEEAAAAAAVEVFKDASQPKMQRHCSNRLYCFFCCLSASCLHFVGLLFCGLALVVSSPPPTGIP
jgi:hypothetical protein